MMESVFFVLQVRLSSGNRDFHYTHWTVLPDRFLPNEIAAVLGKATGDGVKDGDPPCEIFYCNQEENTSLRYEHTTLLMK